MVLFAAMLQVALAVKAMAVVEVWQHPLPGKRVLHALQELPVNEA